MNEIMNRLFELRDEKYKEFISKLVPTVGKERFLGVRANGLKKVIKEYSGTQISQDFLGQLPHFYYEENIIHVAFLSNEKENFENVFELCEKFFPYIDNWGVCDSLSPIVFARNPDRLLLKIKDWIHGSLWVSRFALNMLMRHFLQENFSDEILELALEVKTGEYYVDMGLAWFLSFALIHRYYETLPYIESRKLPQSVQKKTIQKAVDSFRISEERKNYLKTYR